MLFSQFQRVGEIAITPRIADESLTIMAEFQMKSYDAIHVASALVLNATALLTTDADFERVGLSGIAIRRIQ